MRGYPQAPSSIGEVLDRGISLYRDAFRLTLPLTATFAVMMELPAFWNLLARDSGLALLGVPIVVVSMVVGIAAFAGLPLVLDAAARGEALAPRAAVRAGVSRLLPVLGGFVLYFFAVLAGMLLFIIPGVIVMISLSFGWILIMVDRRNAIDGVVESHRLVWGKWWRTLVIMTVAALLYYIPFLLILAVVGGIWFMLGMIDPGQGTTAILESMAVPLSIVSLLSNALLLTLTLSISLVQLRDLQLRKTGTDLAQRAEAA